jgi:hypothetical protein
LDVFAEFGFVFVEVVEAVGEDQRGQVGEEQFQVEAEAGSRRGGFGGAGGLRVLVTRNWDYGYFGYIKGG